LKILKHKSNSFTSTAKSTNVYKAKKKILNLFLYFFDAILTLVLKIFKKIKPKITPEVPNSELSCIFFSIKLSSSDPQRLSCMFPTKLNYNIPWVQICLKNLRPKMFMFQKPRHPTTRAEGDPCGGTGYQTSFLWKINKK
jgi:hypothetical protein